MITCPYCQEDLSSPYEEIAKMGRLGMRAVTLCHNCGEPVVTTETGFRKPTADEHVDLHENTRLRYAREAFLRVQRSGPVITKMWQDYCMERREQGSKLTILESEQHLLHSILRDVFYEAVASTIALVKRTIETSENTDEFTGTMMLVESELAAYREFREEQDKILKEQMQ